MNIRVQNIKMRINYLKKKDEDKESVMISIWTAELDPLNTNMYYGVPIPS